jgi:hypothetical protein
MPPARRTAPLAVYQCAIFENSNRAQYLNNAKMQEDFSEANNRKVSREIF